MQHCNDISAPTSSKQCGNSSSLVDYDLNDYVYRRFQWEIQNFSKPEVSKLYSEPFTCGGYQWRLLLFPQGNNNKKGVDCMSLYLENYTIAQTSARHKSKQVVAKLRLWVQNQKELHEYQTTTGFLQHTYSKSEVDWGISQFLSLVQMNNEDGWLLDDRMTLGVDLKVKCRLTWNSIFLPASSSTSWGNLVTQFNKQQYSDCTVRSKDDGVSFYCHRVLLAARSSFFDGAFKSGMTESLTQIVSIPDCDSQLLGGVLHYLYGQTFTIDQQNVFQAFHLADMLGIVELRRACEEYLVDRAVLMRKDAEVGQKALLCGSIEVTRSLLGVLALDIKECILGPVSLQLPVEDMETLLPLLRQNIDTTHQLDCCNKLLLRWACHAPAARVKHLPKLRKIAREGYQVGGDSAEGVGWVGGSAAGGGGCEVAFGSKQPVHDSTMCCQCANGDCTTCTTRSTSGTSDGWDQSSGGGDTGAGVGVKCEEGGYEYYILSQMIQEQCETSMGYIDKFLCMEKGVRGKGSDRESVGDCHGMKAT